VIVVTGMKDRAIERKMMNLGAEVVLTKPVEFVTLRRELARHINILAGAAPGFEVPVCETIV
jgi:FixJ family two-component response regulator